MSGDFTSVTWMSVIVVAVVLTLCCPGSGVADTPETSDFIFPDREAFLRQLKLDSPELAAVKAALDQGNAGAAGTAFIAHFRTRPISSPILVDWANIDRNPEYNTSRADGLLAGELWDGYSTYTVPDTGIDWDEAPLTCLTRFPILSTLNYAFHHTHDPKYLRFIVDHVLGYMDAYPIEQFVGKGKEGWRGEFQVSLPWHWCMIDLRLLMMSNSLSLIRHHPEVTDEELLRMLQRMHEETLWLQFYIQGMVDGRHNGGCSWMETMLHVCPVLADFEASDRWLAYNARLLNQYVDQAFYPDGFCIELTTAYSLMVARMTQRMAHAMSDQADFETARPKLVEMITSVIALGAPTGRLPSFGDHYASHFSSGIHRPLLEVLDELDWARALVDKQDGPQPPFTVWPRPGQEQWTGYYTMRSDWTPEARFMMIDGGPWGTTHQHGDRLSFFVSAYGADLIIDPTQTKYHDNSPDAFLSRHQPGFLHNVITVDGVDQFMYADDEQGQRVRTVPIEAKEPLQNTWEHGDAYSLFVSDYSYAPILDARWERRVVFVDRAYWLLQDVITGTGFAGADEPVALEQNFQFEMDTEIEFDGNVTIATAPNGARLVLLPLESMLMPELTIGDETPRQTYWRDGIPKTDWGLPHPMRSHGRGWTGRWTGKLMPAPAVTYVGETSLPATLTVAIIPLAPGQDMAQLPDIAKDAVGARTVWTLPTAASALHVETDIDVFQVRP